MATRVVLNGVHLFVVVSLFVLRKPKWVRRSCWFPLDRGFFHGMLDDWWLYLVRKTSTATSAFAARLTLAVILNLVWAGTWRLRPEEPLQVFDVLAVVEVFRPSDEVIDLVLD